MPPSQTSFTQLLCAGANQGADAKQWGNHIMKTTLILASALCLAGQAWSQQPTTPAAPAPGSSASPAPAQPTAAPTPWLLGAWAFDAEYTQKKHAEAKKEPNVTEALGSAVASQLLDKMKGAKLVVTEKELTMTRGDGNGKSESYTVIPGTDPNMVQLKQANGEVLAFHREGDRIWMNSTGSVNEPFYFKREK